MDRMIGLDLQTLIATSISLINVSVLCFIMYKLLYNPVKKFLAARTERITTQLLNTDTNLKNAEALKADYEEKLSHIENERLEIYAVAQKRALEKYNQILMEAKQESEAIKSRAMLDIKREQAKAKDEMKTQIIEVSSLMASRFVANSMDTNMQNKLLEEVISDLEDVKWLN